MRLDYLTGTAALIGQATSEPSQDDAAPIQDESPPDERPVTTTAPSVETEAPEEGADDGPPIPEEFARARSPGRAPITNNEEEPASTTAPAGETEPGDDAGAPPEDPGDPGAPPDDAPGDPPADDAPAPPAGGSAGGGGGASGSPEPKAAPDTGSGDEAAAELQVKIDDAEQAWIDAQDAYYAAWDKTLTPDDQDHWNFSPANIAKTKSLKNAVEQAFTAYSALAGSQTVAGDPIANAIAEVLGTMHRPPAGPHRPGAVAPGKIVSKNLGKKLDPAAVKQARELHQKTAVVHTNSRNLLKRVNGRKQSAGERSTAQSLRGQRQDLRFQRAALRAKLRAQPKPGDKPKAGETEIKPPPPIMPAGPAKPPGPTKPTPTKPAAKPGHWVGTGKNRKWVVGEDTSMSEAALTPPANHVLKSPLDCATDAQWTKFIFAMKTADLDTVGPANEQGMFAMRPRRLVDLGLGMDLESTRMDSGRMGWVFLFVPPMTEELFLGPGESGSDAKHAAAAQIQLDTFTRSMLDYVAAIRAKTIPSPAVRPAGLTLSGALAVLHRCGPSGLKSWADVSSRRQDTITLVDCANGAF